MADERFWKGAKEITTERALDALTMVLDLGLLAIILYGNVQVAAFLTAHPLEGVDLWAARGFQIVGALYTVGVSVLRAARHMVALARKVLKTS